MKWLISLLSTPILNSLVKAYEAKLKAQGTQDAQAVDLAKAEILAEIEARKAAKEVLIAEQGHWYTAMMRPLLALPVAIFLWKVIVFDKVLGWGVTDKLDVNLWNVVMVVIAAYFGGNAIDKVAQVFRKR